MFVFSACVLTRTPDWAHLRDLSQSPATSRFTAAHHLGVLSAQLRSTAAVSQSRETGSHTLIWTRRIHMDVMSRLSKKKKHLKGDDNSRQIKKSVVCFYFLLLYFFYISYISICVLCFSGLRYKNPFSDNYVRFKVTEKTVQQNHRKIIKGMNLILRTSTNIWTSLQTK